MRSVILGGRRYYGIAPVELLTSMESPIEKATTYLWKQVLHVLHKYESNPVQQAKSKCSLPTVGGLG